MGWFSSELIGIIWCQRRKLASAGQFQDETLNNFAQLVLYLLYYVKADGLVRWIRDPSSDRVRVQILAYPIIYLGRGSVA